MEYESIREKAWKIVLGKTTISEKSLHGPGHWKRVEKIGLDLAEKTGADKMVVSLFALFHDCMRLSDGTDPGHGLRGAEFAKSIQHELNLTGGQFKKLYFACQWHTEQTHTDNPTIATCWDADRLDLFRVGVMPKTEFLNSKSAKDMARRILWGTKGEGTNSVFWHIHQPLMIDPIDNWRIGETKHIGDRLNPSGQSMERIIKHSITFASEKFNQLTLLEKILEEVRLKHFPDKPSRMRGLFVFRNDKDIDYWIEKLILNLRKPLQTVKILKLSLVGNIHQGNYIDTCKFLDLKGIGLEDYYQNAFKYWRSETTDDPNNPDEFLFEGAAKVLDILSAS